MKPFSDKCFNSSPLLEQEIICSGADTSLRLQLFTQSKCCKEHTLLCMQASKDEVEFTWKHMQICQRDGQEQELSSWNRSWEAEWRKKGTGTGTFSPRDRRVIEKIRVNYRAAGLARLVMKSDILSWKRVGGWLWGRRTASWHKE